MTRKELNGAVAKLVKWINANKDVLELKDDIMIPPKMSVEETQDHINSLEEHIMEVFAETPPPEEFVLIYNAMCEAFTEFEKENPSAITGTPVVDPQEEKESATTNVGVASNTNVGVASNTNVGAAPNSNVPTSGFSSGTPGDPKVKAPTKKHTKKETAPAPKVVVPADEKDKVIKKLFEALAPEALDGLDPATMRIILKVMK